ncbi:MAG: hypothetical protein ACRYG4_20375 [Janthinobacterium lividum]
MSVDQISLDRAGVTAAVRLASARTGVDFAYLYTEAKVESGLRADAAAATGSARGLYQFTAGAWLDVVARHGAEQGLGDAADAVASGAAARDPLVRAQVLALRGDPQAAALMAAALAIDNAAKVTAGTGRPAGATELYLAHFLGAAGAIRFLRARDGDPAAAAADVVPAAAGANRAVFFAGGAPRSLDAVYARFAARFSGNPVPAGGNELPVAAPVMVADGATAGPQAARFAYLLLAELGA